MKMIGIGIGEDTRKVISSIINSGISDQVAIYCKPGTVSPGAGNSHHSYLSTSGTGPGD